MCVVHRLLTNSATSVCAVIVKPETAWESNCQRSKTDRSGESDQVVEDRDSLSQKEGDRRETNGAGEPGAPMHHCILLEMWRVSENANKEILRCDVKVKGS